MSELLESNILIFDSQVNESNRIDDAADHDNNSNCKEELFYNKRKGEAVHFYLIFFVDTNIIIIRG